MTIALSAASAAPAALPAAPLNSPLSDRIQAVVRQALEAQRLVGAVVLVARGGALVHRQAAGWADRERGLPMAVDTVFRLASASKPIVSAAALVLVLSDRSKARAAAVQGTFPLVGLLALLVSALG